MVGVSVAGGCDGDRSRAPWRRPVAGNVTETGPRRRERQRMPAPTTVRAVTW